LAGVVLDEAQNSKIQAPNQSRAVRQLDASVSRPCRNAVESLVRTLVNFRLSESGLFGSRNFFQRRFAIPIERYGGTTSLQTLDRWRNRLSCGD
jgi:hypothetical protein